MVFAYLWAHSWVRRGSLLAALGAACTRSRGDFSAWSLWDLLHVTEPRHPPRPKGSVMPACQAAGRMLTLILQELPPLLLQTLVEQGQALFWSEILPIFLGAPAEYLDAH